MTLFHVRLCEVIVRFRTYLIILTFLVSFFSVTGSYLWESRALSVSQEDAPHQKEEEKDSCFPESYNLLYFKSKTNILLLISLSS